LGLLAAVNVLVLQTGIDGWRKDAAYKP
jgi:hypothetical protein